MFVDGDRVTAVLTYCIYPPPLSLFRSAAIAGMDIGRVDSEGLDAEFDVPENDGPNV